MKLTVEIAGSAATPDGAGKYTVLPGQQVVVKASDSAAWLGSAQGTGVTRTDVDTTATQWISRFANSGATDGSFKLVASASSDRSKELNFVVRTGDYRNGDYMVFAANGSRQTLSVDFDKKTYDVTDAAGDKTSGMLVPSPPSTDAGTFQSSRNGIPNISSFQSLTDSIVGAFPFAVPFLSPVTYAGVPFVATRAFVVTQAKLDGTYDRARIEVTNAGQGSAIAQIQISGGGTVMKQCTDLHIYRIENCPPASVATSSVEADGATGLWTLKDAVTGTLLGRFGIANIDGDKVYLSAGLSPATGGQVLAIGVPAAAGYADFNAGGWATDHTLNISAVSSAPPQYSLSSTGPVLVTTLALSALAADSPTGIRSAVSGADKYFAMRSKRLDLLIGEPGKPATQGFLHVGVIQ
ncbi:hypothetical protein [Variovorax boronicumulans]|uniref:hypothetical protein n=1 Tax=Variovorax boronicumulans TaxID=436515 RepID=UPI00277FEE6C|nr:hypothetical protein [Variovorax boronicumulans]MDQ0045133.1 hypothetical protein [Variovorax boronicumulans]